MSVIKKLINMVKFNAWASGLSVYLKDRTVYFIRLFEETVHLKKFIRKE